MLTKTEIKKEGWKPIQKKDKDELDKYTLKIHGRNLYLTIENEETISIVEFAPADMEIGNTNPMTATRTLFFGHIPKRYELRIIMRCLKIG